MKPKTRQPVPLSLFYLRSAPVRDLGLRAIAERRVRPFFIHTLILRSQRSNVVPVRSPCSPTSTQSLEPFTAGKIMPLH